MDIKLNIILHPQQNEIHKSKARFVVVKAGKRFGKTKLALYRLIQRAGQYPGDVFWYIAPTYKQAKSIAWHELNRLLPPELVKRSNETELMKELINGSKIYLIGADNEDSLRGVKIRAVVFDEYAYTDEYAWIGIVSGQLLGEDSYSFADFISSPNKKGRNHFTNFFNEAARKQREGDPEWAAFYYTIFDNPTISLDEINKLRDSIPDDTWNLEYMALEGAYAGLRFSEFKPELNIMETPSDVSVLLQFRGLDWGMDHPTVCLWARLDRDKKQLYITDEFVKSGFTIEESCGAIKARTQGQVQWSVIDPSTKKRNSQTKRSDSLEFNRNGIPVLLGDNGNRGYDIVQMFLKKGVLKIHPKCKTLIYELKNLQKSDTEGDDCCLVAGTKILCDDGIKNIEDIKVGDYVFTRDGYKTVTVSSITDLNADVFELTLINNKKITGTYNHPMFMCDGTIKQLGDLKYGDKLLDIRCLCLIYSVIWKLKSLLQPVRNLTVCGIIYVENITRELQNYIAERNNFIGWCGDIISEKYRQSIISTIRIITGITTRLGILNVYPVLSIYHNITERQKQEKDNKNTLKSQFNTLQNGINQKKEENGTVFTEKNVGKIKSCLKEIVISAEEFTELLSLPVLNIAILIAKWLRFIPVIQVASVISLPTKQPVYNLTIAENSEYIANGLLVHNCDALRYLCVRIHDYMFGMNILNIDSNFKPNPMNLREMNLNDPLMFPETKKVNDMNWLLQEIA